MSPILGIWASQGRVIAGDFESIATTTITSTGVSSITFSSIPQTYKHLQIRFIGRSAYTGGTGPDNWNIRINGDSNSVNYYRHMLRGNGSSVDVPSGGDNAVISSISTSNDAANLFGVGVIDLLDYSSGNKNKTMRILSGIDYNGSGFIQLQSMFWAFQAAVTSFTAYQGSNWAVGTQFALYGIKG